MSAPPYMKLWIGDYMADAGHLSRADHGAYLLLLFAMWRAEGRLPRDKARLAALARCTLAEWEGGVADVVLPFFKVDGRFITHSRVTAELATYQNTVRGAKAAGKASAEKRANKSKGLGSTDVGTDVQRTLHQSEPESEPSKKGILSGQPDVADPAASFKPSAAKPLPAPVMSGATDDDVSAVWAITPKASRERSSRGDVKRALTAAMYRNHTPADVLAGLVAYFATDDATRDEARFAKGVHRMIEADRWETFAPAAKAPMPESRWKHALAYWHRDGSWDDRWGPKPGEPGCEAPAHLLIRAAT